MSHTHRYAVRASWTGSTGAGYEGYDRDHEVGGLEISADPAFRGNPERRNPEELLLAAASSCQLLSFLAVAARARVDVRAYEDEAEAVMPEDDPPVRVTRIVLRPRVEVAGDVAPERLHKLTELAHRSCFIANSLKCDIAVEPSFTILPAV